MRTISCETGQSLKPGTSPARFTRYAACAFALWLLFAFLPAAGFAEDGAVRELLVNQANTPAEHAASAHYYAAKAQEARQEVSRHLEMGTHYADGPMKERRKQQIHCERIAALHLQLADEYEALARNHLDESRSPKANDQK